MSIKSCGYEIEIQSLSDFLDYFSNCYKFVYFLIRPYWFPLKPTITSYFEIAKGINFCFKAVQAFRFNKKRTIPIQHLFSIISKLLQMWDM